MRRSVLLVLLCAALVLGLAPVAAAAPAAPAADDGVDYVALGDSYAAGVGAASDGSSGDCRRSDGSYPARWARAGKPATFVSVACSGATSGRVLLRQARTVSRDTDLVTLTVGGNDSGFAAVLGACTVAVRDEDCASAVNGGERIARYAVPVGVTAVIAAVKVQSPRARVVVLGYPRLFDDGPECDVPMVPNATRRAALNRAADTLNTSLRTTATRFGGTYVDVTGRFDGHELCTASPWINPPTDPPSASSYHPTSRGYARAYLPALADAVGRG